MDNGMMTGLSASDVALLGKDNNAFGNEGLWIFALLFLMFGFGNNGFNNNGFGATSATQHEILLGQQFETVNNKLNDIGKGICDSTYALNNSIKDCCCNTQLGIAHLDAKIDQQTGVFTAMLKDAENQRLRDRVNSLELNEAMCGVVRYPMQMNYCTPCNPFGGCGYQTNI